MSKLKKIKYFIIVTNLFVGILLVDQITYAQTGCGENTACLNNPLASTEPHILVGQIIRAFLGVLGSLSLLMFMFGGLQLILSGGNAERVKKGRDTMIWAIIGIAATLSSFAILKFVFNSLAN